MAVYHLYLKNFGRANGSSAVGAAAYRAGERLRDERTGRIHDHAARPGVMHAEIVLPDGLAGPEPAWLRDRAGLWNAAEAAESRKNARVAREYLVALPAELDHGRRLALARGFSQELADRYRFAVDLSIHGPRDYAQSDPRNFHAHLLATTREVSIEGLGAKTALELSDTRRRALGLGPAVNELFHVRERWAVVTNEALRAAGLEARVDHRSLAARGIDRLPRPYIPRIAFELERQGHYSPVAERMRERHRALEAQRQERAASAPRQAPAGIEALEELRRQARENWLRMREGSARAAAEPAADRSRDDDLAP